MVIKEVRNKKDGLLKIGQIHLFFFVVMKNLRKDDIIEGSSD